MKKKQKQQQTRPAALDRQIERRNAAVLAKSRSESERVACATAACQRAWDESGEAKVYVQFLPSEHGNGYLACIESRRKNWRKLYGDLRGIARVREVIGASDRREAFAAEVVAFLQSGGVRFVDRREPVANGLALSRPWWTAQCGNYEGDVPRLLLNYTMAERVLRLMEMAQDSLRRGDGRMARLQATAARHYRRRHFPGRERQTRGLELEQPCPALPMPAPAAVEAEYDGLYIAHFGADRKAAA